MPHIARLDEQGMLLGIEDCCHEDHKTDPIARTVALEEGHDMHQRAKGYRWDFARQCFLPLSAEPLEAAERDTAELVEGIVEALEHIEATMKVVAAEADAASDPGVPTQLAEARRAGRGGRPGMTQASDLGGIANQLAAFYRARVNVNLQALATQHYGAIEPPVMYANMVWFDSGTGYVKLRCPTNSAWQTIGTIGPPMKFTNVDLPDTAWTHRRRQGDLQAVADAGWVMMNDGTIGDGCSGAYTRANPDTWALFTLLWYNIADASCTIFAAGTGTRTGRGASAVADFAAHRHLCPAPSARPGGRRTPAPGLAYSTTLSDRSGERDRRPRHHQHAVARSQLLAVPAAHPRCSVNVEHVAGQQPLRHVMPTTAAVGDHPARPRLAARHGNTSAAGSGVAHFNLPPSTYLNFMIKL